MKTTRYKFEQTVQSANANSIEWLKDELRAILESDKDYTRKADYIGFSVLSIDNRIQSIDEEIKELYNNPDYSDIIQKHTRLDVESIPKPAKIKINKRRTSANNEDHTTMEVAS